jgi:hypothetical protein
MKTYKYAFEGPTEAQIRDTVPIGTVVSAASPTPAITKDITIDDDSDDARTMLSEGMTERGWRFLEEVIA